MMMMMMINRCALTKKAEKSAKFRVWYEIPERSKLTRYPYCECQAISCGLFRSRRGEEKERKKDE